MEMERIAERKGRQRIIEEMQEAVVLSQPGRDTG